MRTPVLVFTACAAGALLTACGSASVTGAPPSSAGSSTPSAPVTVTVTASPTATSTATASPSPTGPPHFATPQAAMVYLAAAYNSGNETDLMHVTTPDARQALDAMRSEAVDLRLVSCTANAGRGDDTCVFDHDYPAGYHPPTPNPEGPAPDGSKGGWAEFTVAPATAPGWYMTVLEQCG